MLSLDRVGRGGAGRAGRPTSTSATTCSSSGEVITSRRGELSVLADAWAIAAKALRPLPVAHKPTERGDAGPAAVRRPDRPAAGARHGAHPRPRWCAPLRDGVARPRVHRGRDPDAADCCTAARRRGRSSRTSTRSTSTSTCGSRPSCSSSARVVGGIERVFEINRNFRNEGADSTHSPEFAMLEAYQAYADYNDMAALTRELVQECVRAVFGSRRRSSRRRHRVRPRRGVASGDAVRRGLRRGGPGGHASTRSAERPARARRPSSTSSSTSRGSPGKLVEELFEHLVEHTLIAPTFVLDYPLDTSPLTRAHRAIRGVAEKWDLYVAASSWPPATPSWSTRSCSASG